MLLCTIYGDKLGKEEYNAVNWARFGGTIPEKQRDAVASY